MPWRWQVQFTRLASRLSPKLKSNWTIPDSMWLLVSFLRVSSGYSVAVVMHLHPIRRPGHWWQCYLSSHGKWDLSCQRYNQPSLRYIMNTISSSWVGNNHRCESTALSTDPSDTLMLMLVLITHLFSLDVITLRLRLRGYSCVYSYY